MEGGHPVPVVAHIIKSFNAIKLLSCALQSKQSIYNVGVTLLEHIFGHAKFSVTLSSNGGIDNQTDYSIRVQKNAHHILSQIVTFAKEFVKMFCCHKSLPLRGITIINGSPHSPCSLNVYEDRLLRAKAQAELFHSGSTMSVTSRPGDNIFVGAYDPEYGKKVRIISFMVTARRFKMLDLSTCYITELPCHTSILSSLQHLCCISSYVKFTVAPSPKGGIDIKVGCDSIHVPKYFSAHHPLIQMVLFADKDDDGKTFWCQKYMAPKSIVKMANASGSFASRIEYEAGWISANTKSQSPKTVFPESGSGKSRGRNNERSVPVIIDTSSNVSATPPIGDDGFVLDSGIRTISQNDPDHDMFMKLESKQIIAGSVDGGTNSSITCERLVANDPGNDHSINPHSNGTSGLTSSPETTLVPMERELGETKLEYNSDPDFVATVDRVITITEEAKASAKWLVATAAPHHATGNRALITDFVPFQDKLIVQTADDTPMQVIGCGNVVSNSVVLSDVWYVPGLTANLVSVSQLADLDYSVGFGRAECYIRSPTGVLVGSARVGDEGLFEVHFLKV